MTGLGVVLFVVSVLFAIGLHEAGHFATAKWFKIKVDRFFIGFGPKIWSTKRGETEYGIAALPLGGYVRIAGMNPLEEIEPEDRPRTFKAKPAWQRAIVLAAGSITHFLVALVIIAAILASVGEPDINHPTLEIASVGSTVASQGSPAEKAGLKPGDVIVALNGQRVTKWDQVVSLIHAKPGQTVTITVLRKGHQLNLPATLADKKPDGTKVGFLGVSPTFAVKHFSLPAAVGESGARVVQGMGDSLAAFKHIFAPSTLGRLFKVAAGKAQRRATDPATAVGIAKASGDLARSGDFVGLFLLVAGFNIFVGVANLLPLPPLDGGHLAVLAIEKITRREIDMRRLIPITAMVLSIFATLFVLLLYLDIVRPIPSIPG